MRRRDGTLVRVPSRAYLGQHPFPGTGKGCVFGKEDGVRKAGMLARLPHDGRRPPWTRSEDKGGDG